MLGLLLMFSAVPSAGPPVSPEQQQLLAAAQLADEDATQSRALRDAINKGELSRVDRALLEQRIKKVNPDGTPERSLWSAGSVAMGVGGLILLIGGVASALLWRKAESD
jgi:hypothetical protein